MPPTRTSMRARSSRIDPRVKRPNSKNRRTRDTAYQSEASTSEDQVYEAISERATRQRANVIPFTNRYRDASFDGRDPDITPRARATRHTRTHSSTRISTSIHTPNHDLQGRRRLHIRPSLTGAQVEEMTIERRAEMVADVAGDCLLKLLRAGLQGDQGERKRDMEWRKAWGGLQSKSLGRIAPIRAIAASLRHRSF